MPTGEKIDKNEKIRVAIEAIELKKNGKSTQEIAKIFGRGKSTIDRWIREYKAMNDPETEIELGELGENLVSVFSEEFGEEPEISESIEQEIPILVWFDNKSGKFLETAIKVKSSANFEEIKNQIKEHIDKNIHSAILNKANTQICEKLRKKENTS